MIKAWAFIIDQLVIEKKLPRPRYSAEGFLLASEMKLVLLVDESTVKKSLTERLFLVTD